MYDSRRFLSAAKSLPQQNFDMIVVLQTYNLLLLWNFHSDVSLFSTYTLIHLNNCLKFYFQCNWYNEEPMCCTSPGLILGNFPSLQNVTTGSCVQPPIQWVSGVLSLTAKWLGHEADHSTPANTEVKYKWCYTSTPMCLHGSNTNNLTFPLAF
jgi:hypothetical protein